MKEKYDTYLCQKANPRATVDSLGLQVGDHVWIRIFAFSERLAYLSSLLPRFKVAKILAILGKSSIVLEDLETGRKITRHLADCYPIKPVGNFSNLFLNSKAAVQQEVDEDFGGMPESNLPGIYKDGVGVDQFAVEQPRIDEEKLEEEPSVEEVDKWCNRLRRRGVKINYKE